MEYLLKKDTGLVPPNFQRYIDQVADAPVVALLKSQAQFADKELLDQIIGHGDDTYGPGKWTLKTILQHIIDTERILTYRALRIARADTTPLPGYDENSFAEHTIERPWKNLLEEFEIVRQSSIQLFQSFDGEMLVRRGTTSNVEISVLALGYVIAGHQVHHLNIIRNRYFNAPAG